ncbi:MAG: tetratricopeptide repeat protein [Dokdonella sp.]
MLKTTIELHRQGDLDAAESGYREFLAEHPNDNEALRLLGAVRYQKGDRDGAIDLLQRSHNAAPEQPAPLLTLGKVYFDSREFDQARDVLSKVLSLDPNQGGAHTTLGHVALAEGDTRLAEQHFHTSLRAGDDAHAFAGLAMVACDFNQPDIAVKNANQAAKMQPQDALIQFTLGRALLLNGNHAFAEQAFNNALALRPNFPQVHHALGMLLLDNNRASEAEQQFGRLRSEPGFEAGADVGIADAMRAQGRFNDAIPLYKSALEAAPNWDKVVEALLFCLGQTQQLGDALVLLNQQVDAGGEREAFWRNRRVLLTTHLNQLDLAIADNEWLHEAEPDELQYVENLGYLNEQIGNFEAAEPYVAAVLAKNPGSPEMSLVRIRQALRNDDFDGASDRLDALASKELREGQRRLLENYRGRVADHNGAFGIATEHFLAAQRGLRSLLPALTDIPESIDRWLAAPAGPVWEHAPILLIGTPGSGVERIAALLADQPSLAVPRDRVGDRDRRDLFGTPAFDHSNADISADEVAHIRDEYLGPVRAMGIPDGLRQVDWLPRWDARLLTLIHRIMPGTRIIVADRDARAALVDWMAFGWLPTAPVNDLEAATAWLAKARDHALYGVARSGPEHLVVDAAAIAADPEGAGAELAKFVGLETLVVGDNFARGVTGIGGLPVRFAGDHWRNYSDALADSFAKLKPRGN